MQKPRIGEVFKLRCLRDFMLGLHARGIAVFSCHTAAEPVMADVASVNRCSGQLQHHAQPSVQLHTGRRLSVTCAAASGTGQSGKTKGLGLVNLHQQGLTQQLRTATSNHWQQPGNHGQLQPYTVGSNRSAGIRCSRSGNYSGQSTSSTGAPQEAAIRNSASSGHSSTRNNSSSRPGSRAASAPKPRRSSSARAPLNESAAGTAAAAKQPSPTVAADPSRAAAAAATRQTTRKKSAAAAATRPAAAAAATTQTAVAGVAAADSNRATVGGYTQHDIAMRNAHKSRKSAAPLQPPKLPPSEAAVRWCNSLGISNEVLQKWKAGMASVPHPTDGQQVQVLALPYYRFGTLVDVRYLHIVNDQLLGSWLAKQASQMFMNEEEVQGADIVVFVGSEVEVLLLSSILQAAGGQDSKGQKDTERIAVIAMPPQTPLFLDNHHQQPNSPAVQLLQLDLTQHQQQRSLSPPEDPRWRLEGLLSELRALKQGHDLEGEVQVTGLHLLLPGAKRAVIAVDRAPLDSAAGVLGTLDRSFVAQYIGPASAALADVLGPVDCEIPSWSFESPMQYASQQEKWWREKLCEKGIQLELVDATATAAAGGAAGASKLQQQISAAQTAAEQQLSLVDSEQWQAVQRDLRYYETFYSLLLQLQHIQQIQGAPAWTLSLSHVLQGADVVENLVRESWRWPLDGLERFTDYTEQIVQFYRHPSVDEIALSTGWDDLDNYYKVIPGEVTIVTGVPNSGKSEWLDALAVNLMELHGWRFAVCSMEKRPRDHIRQLLEKYARQPMLKAVYAEGVHPMSEQVLKEHFDKLAEHFFVITSAESSMPTLQWVLETATAAKIRHNINGLIIDPFNELDQTLQRGLNLHEHVNQFMADLRTFARENNVHCWLVAHPRQMSEWTGAAPGLGTISGGANFQNKTDNGIIVHRDWSKLKELQRRAKAGSTSDKKQQSKGKSKGSSENGTVTAAGVDEGLTPEEQEQLHRMMREVQIIVAKVRNKAAGQRGCCWLMYDRVTGRYYQPNQNAERKQLEQPDDVVMTDAPENLEVSMLPEEAEVEDSYMAPPAAYTFADFQQQDVGEEETLAAHRERAHMAS